MEKFLGLGVIAAICLFFMAQAADRSTVITLAFCAPPSKMNDLGYCSGPVHPTSDIDIHVDPQSKTVEVITNESERNFLTNCQIAGEKNWECDAPEVFLKSGMIDGRYFLSVDKNGLTPGFTSIRGWQREAYKRGIITFDEALKWSGAPSSEVAISA